MNEYNGHANYPTWAVSLWLDNEPKTFDMACKLADDPNVPEGELLKQIIEERNPLLDRADMYTDILGFALAHVDYDRIVENHKEENL